MTVAITATALSKRYQIGEFQAGYGTLRDSVAAVVRRRGHRRHRDEIWALRDVSFAVGEGEVVGVIGHNGAGKSTLLKVLTRITAPTAGRAEIRGRVGSLLEVGTGFHPELTGRENIFLNGAVLGMKRREITRKFDEIVEFSGIDKFLDTPVKRYSSGMYVRLAFSVAAHLEPEILLVDEVLAVGDAEFQRRCLGRMEDIGESGRTILFVSHNMQAMTTLCDRAVLLEQGRVVADGPSSEVVATYLQSVHGTGSSRYWNDPASAPRDDLVLLRHVRVVDETGDTVAAVDVRRPVGIEIGFTVLRDGRPLYPKVKLTDQQGNVIFNAMDVSGRWDVPSTPGDYAATAWVPANLLNEGLISVEAAVVSLQAPRVHVHAGWVDVVSFHVQDPGEGDSARGRFTGQWKGVVRPLLEWTVEER
jgi:lipopolysaccharide transport system ATP-binding protein